MTTAAPPLRSPAGVIIPTHAGGTTSSGALITSALLTLLAVAGLAVLSWWYPLIAFLAAGAGAGYSLSGSV